MMSLLRGICIFSTIFVAIAAKSQQIDQNRRVSNCGGSMKSDSSSITFPISPTEDTLLPGEACIWTIHLESTRGFQFTLTNYSDSSNDSDCSEAGIRIYSLTNLAPDKLQSYTFCSAKPPPDNFFLNENVAAVVVYVSGSVSVDSVNFSQFGLAWEGSTFDPFETKHVGSFSNSPTGVIRYPIVGQYESSLAATWAISADSTQGPTKVDFVLERLGLQSCTNPDSCLCDALILYAISESGVLEENQRFCSDSQEITLQGVDSKFIVGFFTDSQAQSDTGTGFQINHHISDSLSTTNNPSTSTTHNPTSTEYASTIEPGLTECGTVLTSSSGSINYKENYNYDPNERCIWVIRVPGAIGYEFSFKAVGFNGQPADGLAILTLRRNQADVIESYRLITSPGFQQMNGSVAYIMLFSDESVQYNGISFTYQAIISTNDISAESNDVFVTGYPDTIRYPENNPSYANQELTTFSIVPGFKHLPGTLFRTDIDHRGLDPTCGCCDHLAIYRFDNTQGAFWRWIYRQCNDAPSIVLEHSDVLFVVFLSDSEGTRSGFQISVREAPQP